MRLSGKYNNFIARGWFKAGTALGLAADLSAGTMLVAVGDGPWAPAFASGVAPGAAVGTGLFLAVSGCDGAKVRLGLGRDAPLRVQAPSRDYVPLGRLAAQVTRDCPRRAGAGLDSDSLCCAGIRPGATCRANCTLFRYPAPTLYWRVFGPDTPLSAAGG